MAIARKSWPKFFERIKRGQRRIEVRIADTPLTRSFDMVLEEWDPKTHEYTGRKLNVRAKPLAVCDVLSFYTLRELMTHPLVVLEYSTKNPKGKKNKK